MKKTIMLEENKYIGQYHNAIYKLMNKSDIKDYEYPLINLVHQTIENEVKSLIAESYYDKDTYQALKIDNCHNLKLLINHQNLKKYYEDITDLENIFKEFKIIVIYFDNVLGPNTFINSRYAVEKKKNQRTSKLKFDYDLFYKNWSRYSELYAFINYIYIAYSYSNTILYFIKQGYDDKRIRDFQYEMVQELKVDKNISEESFALIYMWIDKFVKRNKYYDEKYLK